MAAEDRSSAVFRVHLLGDYVLPLFVLCLGAGPGPHPHRGGSRSGPVHLACLVVSTPGFPFAVFFNQIITYLGEGSSVSGIPR